MADRCQHTRLPLQGEVLSWSAVEDGLRHPLRRRHIRHVILLVLCGLAVGALAARASGVTGIRDYIARHTWRSSARADDIVVLAAPKDCHTVRHGERCHSDIVFAMRHRADHPEWYTGIDNCSTFEDYQEFMHGQVLNSGERRCPKPCRDEHPETPSAKCKKARTKKRNCHTAVPGDECYAHMLYTKREAIRYPSWYPGLGASSSLIDVQHYLKEENVCPEPCELAGADNVSKTLKGCHTALPGESCYQDVVLAKEHFFAKHPDWYPGLKNSSTKEEFQAFLHYQHHADEKSAAKACPIPCNEEIVDKISLRSTCRTAQPGDSCYESIMWGASKGRDEHPDWYAGIPKNASFEDFQIHLHGDNNTKCSDLPCPCHTAQKGEKCYWSIMWVLRTGIHKYPKTFHGLSPQSSLQQVQLHLHKDGTSACGRPCETFDSDPRSPWKTRFLAVAH